MKIIDLDIEVSIEKIMVAFVFKIDGSGIHPTMALINQDIIMLFQIVVLESEIWCFATVVFLLVLCFVNIVIKE